MATLDWLNDRKKWRVRWHATNKERRAWTGSKVFFEKSQAVHFYAEIEEQEKQFRSGSVSPQESVDTAVDEFFRHIKRHTEKTQVHYRMVIGKFRTSLPSSAFRAASITSHQIQEYLYSLRDRGVTNRTSNAHLTAIKSFFSFLTQRHGITNPAQKVIMLQEDPPATRFLSPEEYARVIETATPSARDRYLFIANTGLRASEFYNLTWADVSPQAASITITGKGRKRRTIPLNIICRDILKRISRTGERIFGVNPNAFYSQCQRHARRLAIRKFGPHSFRHWFATQLLIKGVPIPIVAKLLGHSSIRTTETRYMHILPSDIAHVTDCLLTI